MTFLAVCESCGRPYSGTLTSTHTLALGGGMKACRCGNDAFTLIGKGAPSVTPSNPAD